MNVQFLILPPQVRVNPAYPYESKLRTAKRWMEKRGITRVKPVYETKP